jgi:hypothetical protein
LALELSRTGVNVDFNERSDSRNFDDIFDDFGEEENFEK